MAPEVGSCDRPACFAEFRISARSRFKIHGHPGALTRRVLSVSRGWQHWQKVTHPSLPPPLTASSNDLPLGACEHDLQSARERSSRRVIRISDINARAS